LREDRHVGLRRAPFLLALVLISAAPAAGAVVVKDSLYGVKALSASEAWAVGNFGSIYHTTDAGQTWDASESGTKVPLFAVDFAPQRDGHPKDGWAVGKSSTVLHTADGGRTWKPQQSAVPAEKHLFNLKVVDAHTVWAVGDWGAIEVTHDGGATWQNRSLGTITVKVEDSGDRVASTLTDDVILYAVSFPDPQHGFIAGEFGTILATSDGGETWEKRDVGTDKTLFGVRFATPDKGWAVGIDGLILHTNDGGRTWVVQHGATGTESIEELGFLDTLKNPGLYDVDIAGRWGVVVGDTGNVFTTSDGGETWTVRELPAAQRLVWMRAVSLVPGTHGFTVGAAGFSAAIDRDQVLLPARP
jgi:photosystem II stability/assembly factor-like uncharacterized protein